MYYYNENEFAEAYNAANRQGNIFDWEYVGRLLLPGDDASIVAHRRGLTVRIGNAPAPENHPIHEFVATHEDELREITKDDLRSYREIVISGRWHNDGSEFQSFEPYLTQKLTREGVSNTERYDYDFFGVGGYGHRTENRPGHTGSYTFRTLIFATERIVDYSHLSPGLAERLGLPTGMVWHPATPSALPFLVVEHPLKMIEQLSA